ncbi:MAG TPA: HD domain-containing phosphohydrolase [Acidimicrobiia bacterium]|nr:HD domain-containing phosphohydrolase [Acidimicrobiia bacterium]
MALFTGRLRLAELLASLSLATDLATGTPLGHGLRTCLLAVRVAGEMGLGPEQVRSVHQVSLLRFLGCTGEVSELARVVGGDELSFNFAMAHVLNGDPVESLKATVRAVGPGKPPLRKAALLLGALSDRDGATRTLSAHCEVAAMLASRLGLGEPVIGALQHAYERWDGKGLPNGTAGEAIPLEIRISSVARDIDLAVHGNRDPMVLLNQRRGKAYDPRVVDAFDGIRHHWSGEADWEELLESEPDPVSQVDDLDHALTVLADFVDLKSPWTRGHSRRVADLAKTAAHQAGLGLEGANRLHRAGLVHDLGRVGVENGIWDKPGPLSVDEWEKVMLHPYLTDRVLSRCPALQPLGELASRHHERLDGSGYHRQVGADHLSVGDNILAAADTLVALTSDRPHRGAVSLDGAVEAMRDDRDAGRLDSDAVAWVVAAAGGELERPAPRNPDGLTDREVEVLRLIAREHTNRRIAERLYISPKTVGRHVENIYSKIGVSTRAGASVYAMEHRLVG